MTMSWGLVGAVGVADVVDAFEEDDVLDAGGGEDVAVEAGEGVGAVAVVEDAIAADALVDDAEVAGGGVGVEDGRRGDRARWMWAPLVACQPSVMLSPKATTVAGWAEVLGASTSTPLRKSQWSVVAGVGEGWWRRPVAAGDVVGLEGEVVLGEGGDVLAGDGEADG